MNHLPLDENESDPVRLWAEIHHLRAQVQGPKGFDTWQDAAIDERVRRVGAEKALAELRWLIAAQIDHAYINAVNSKMEPQFGSNHRSLGVRVAYLEACLENPSTVTDFKPSKSKYDSLGIGYYLLNLVQRKNPPLRATCWTGTDTELDILQKWTGWSGEIKSVEAIQVQEQVGDKYIHFRRVGDVYLYDWVVELSEGVFIIVGKQTFADNYQLVKEEPESKPVTHGSFVLVDKVYLVEAVQWNNTPEDTERVLALVGDRLKKNDQPPITLELPYRLIFEVEDNGVFILHTGSWIVRNSDGNFNSFPDVMFSKFYRVADKDKS